ncbi:MAG TPA: ATP-binding protein [Candidatus Onthousia excrementipullorum]|uniref:ATP-binding protein n=1 Tax=Candidatus Onthousia excrementipullorum TaxID=2840884 RepID=A0A9D1DVL0_9FIRM|nr:ATP-binding protein [Candidatus Onthousia excrementipullorum]
MEIERNYYLNKLITKKENHLIKIVTGIRRCGKSYLLDPIFKNYLLENGVDEKHIIKLELDSIENEEYINPKKLYEYVMNKVIDDKTYYIILDEIQKVDNFESVLNSFLRKPNLDVYVTGSNSKFLSSDIITEFRGRGYEVRVYPLSFSEFMSVYDDNEVKGLDEYINYGGLPLITTFKTREEKIDYLNYQKDNVYINDVVERNDIRNDDELKTLIEIISSSIGSLTNPTKLYNTFVSKGNKSITNKTISLYLKYLEEAFLIEKSKRFDVKGKKYIETPSKYYFVDIGIRNSLINFRQLERTHIMENIIYIELRRRGFNVDVGLVEKRSIENGKKDYKQLEVDFVANKGSDKYYIQSVYSIEDNNKKEQEVQSLLNVGDNFKKIVIVYDHFIKWQDEDGIIYMSLYDFLLNENSLKEA